MAVYVDDIRQHRAAGLRHKRWCHMMADSRSELEDMRIALGMKAEWIQNAGTHREHYDLVPSRRAEAIRLGAIPVSSREIVRMMNERRR